MANLFANSKFENFQKFPLLHGIALKHIYDFEMCKMLLQKNIILGGIKESDRSHSSINQSLNVIVIKG